MKFSFASTIRTGLAGIAATVLMICLSGCDSPMALLGDMLQPPRAATPIPEARGAIVATVNDQPVYEQDYLERAEMDKESALKDEMFGLYFETLTPYSQTMALETLKSDSLDRLINFEVLAQQALKEGRYPETDAEQRSLIEQAKASELNGQTFEQFLKAHNITEGQYNRRVIRNVVYAVMAAAHLPETGTNEERRNGFFQWICKTRQNYDVKVNITFSVSNPPCTSDLPPEIALPGLEGTTPVATPTAVLLAEPTATVSTDLPSPLDAGVVAPDFTLPAPDGTTYSLSQYKGKVVMLVLFAPWCPHCQADQPIFNEVYEKYKDQGVQLLGVSASQWGRNLQEERAAGNTPTPISMDDVIWFRDTYNVPFPMLFDKDVSAARQYGLAFYPTLYIIDRGGKIASMPAGHYEYENGMPVSTRREAISVDYLSRELDNVLK